MACLGHVPSLLGLVLTWHRGLLEGRAMWHAHTARQEHSVGTWVSFGFLSDLSGQQKAFLSPAQRKQMGLKAEA